MRWLLLKDLQILRRSPLLVAMLIIYPIVLALLIGFALSRGPEKPKVVLVNEVPPGQTSFTLGGEKIEAANYADQFRDAVDLSTTTSRQHAVDEVKSGDALAALVIPPDVIQKLSTGLQQPTVEVIYNAEDPVKQQFVESIIKSRLADANAALSKKFIQVGGEDMRLLLTGGKFNLLGRDIDLLGLRRARAIVAAAVQALPADSPLRPGLEQVVQFAKLAIDNFNLSEQVLKSVGSPLKVKQTRLDGGHTPLNAYAVAVAVAVSLMFVTVLLAAGLLALEREENTFSRLVRGLVSRAGLIGEKIGISALCALVVTFIMLAGISGFVGLDWGRFPLWLAALALGGLAFGALGIAIGGLAREVRAASLLAFLLSLPIAFLALVPSGAVSNGLYDVIRVVSALFPFKPSLDALNSAINGGGDFGLALIHLAILTLAFAVIGRVALRRFA